MKRVKSSSVIAFLAAISFFIIIFAAEDCDICFSAPVMAVKFFIAGIIVITGSIYFTRKFLHAENIIFEIESQPILETDEATDGVPFAGEGIIESKEGRLLASPYTNTACVYFHSIKEVLVRSGKDSHWRIIENTSLFVPFYLKDKRGKLRVDLLNFDDDFSSYKIPLAISGIPNPRNSEIDCDAVLNQSVYTQRGYRLSEFVLRPGTKIFAYGMVFRRDGELVLHENEQCPLIISKKTRDKYVEDFYKGGDLIYLVHFLAAIGYTAALFSLNYFLHLDFGSILILLLIGNIVITGSVIFSLYNRIITLRNRALNSLSNIDAELKRRADLIPALVAAVKGYAKHEKEIQQIIAQARAQILSSKKIVKTAKPTIPALIAVIENYPELKGSVNFQALMKTLFDAEERISYSREFYNRSVRKYNTLIKQFPFTIVSSYLQMKEMDFISIINLAEKNNNV